MAWYVNGGNGSASYNATYFYNFGIEDIAKEIKIKNQNLSRK